MQGFQPNSNSTFTGVRGEWISSVSELLHCCAKMKPLFTAVIILLIQTSVVLAGKTFGHPNMKNPSKEESEFIDERIVSAKLLGLTPSSAMVDIFKLLPTMDKAGDRGPRGRDYYTSISETHFYSSLTVQEDRKGIHNISFGSAFSKPSLEEVEKVASWLLGVFGEPSTAYTRDLKKKAGEELIALVWELDGITVGFSLHFASGVHSSIRVCRNGTKAKDIFSMAGRTNISSKAADISTAVRLWSTSVAGLKN